MFRGEMTPEQVMAAAGTRRSGQFYGNLYVGLYYEAIGDNARARTALEAAASDRYSLRGRLHAHGGPRPRRRWHR